MKGNVFICPSVVITLVAHTPFLSFGRKDTTELRKRELRIEIFFIFVVELYKLTTMKYAIILTEKGEMKVELYENETPIAVNNFVKLATSRFYDGLTFHRVIPDFVIQGGCPIGNGAGGPGYTIKCETSAPRQYHERGVLSMAHRGKDTGGSQFFICHNRQNTQHLDGVHTCFGKVVEGLDVIDDIRPSDLILSITIVEE